MKLTFERGELALERVGQHSAEIALHQTFEQVPAEQPIAGVLLPEHAVDGGAVLGYDDAGAQALRAVAAQIGVQFVSRTDATPLGEALPADETREQAPSAEPVSTAVELYWTFAAVAALLVLVELYLVLREFRRTQPIDMGLRP